MLRELRSTYTPETSKSISWPDYYRPCQQMLSVGTVIHDRLALGHVQTHA